MKRWFIPVLVLLVAGCTQSGINTIFSNLPQVQQFIGEHPNAKIVVNYWTSSEVSELIDEISLNCEKNISVQDMYSVRVSEGNFEVSAWFDKEYNPLCIIKKEMPSEVVSPAESSNASPINHESEVNEVSINDENESSISASNALVLEAESSDGCVKLKWTPYPDSDLRYYKIVRSITNNNPKYPEDGYISVITSRLDNSYTDCTAISGSYYYGVTIVKTDNSKEYTNPSRVTLEKTEDVTHSVSSSSVTLNGEVENSCVKLEWEYEGSSLKYYKVVRSSTNTEPKYPDDGYISVITGIEDKTYTDCDYNKTGVNYYRITVVLPDDSKINSNVLVISNT